MLSSRFSPVGSHLAGRFLAGSRTRAANANASATTPTLDATYREHADFVWRTVNRFGIDPASAEDLVHEIFLVVQRKLPKFDPSRSMKGWLYGISRGVCANYRRSRRRATARLQLLSEPAPPRSPEDITKDSEAADVVSRFLDSLDVNKRTAFELAEIEGLSPSEIAELEGSSSKTIRSRLFVARRLFRNYCQSVLDKQAAEDHGRA